MILIIELNVGFCLHEPAYWTVYVKGHYVQVISGHIDT